MKLLATKKFSFPDEEKSLHSNLLSLQEVSSNYERTAPIAKSDASVVRGAYIPAYIPPYIYLRFK